MLHENTSNTDCCERLAANAIHVRAGMIGYFPLDATEPLLVNQTGNTKSFIKTIGDGISIDFRWQNPKVPVI